MTKAGATLDQLAQLSSIGLAYTFKFLWAPLLDRYALPIMGRRRGWLLATQLALAVAIIVMGQLDPVARPDELFLMAVVVGVLGASQDIVIDAYKVDIVTEDERAAAASAYLIGYRVALVATGTLAFVMADYIAWSLIYALLGVMMAIGVAATLFADEPTAPKGLPTSLDDAFSKPFVEFWRHLGGMRLAIVVAFAILYRFGDYFAQALIIPFFNRGVGFRFAEIAVIYKILGFAGIVIGGVTAGVLVPRFGMRRMLITFGIIQAATNLLYVWLATAGDNIVVFSIAVFVDNTAGAMGTAAFIGYLMSTCTPSVSAMQFALLTSLSSSGQRVFGPLADNVVASVGWQGFFVTTSLLAIPGILLAYYSEPRRKPPVVEPP
jgi:PAT family beta-lactamase induction signal transducer AmpG